MLYKVQRIVIATNERKQTVTNRLGVARVFFGIECEDIGPIIEGPMTEEYGSMWAASETHVINLKVVQD